MTKEILYIDMDNVLVDFQSGINRISPELAAKYEGDLDEVPGIFSLMDPLPSAIEAYRLLANIYDTYILSTSPWLNSSAWNDKLLWVQKHLGIEDKSVAYKRLIISHHKNLNKGDYLVDDRLKNGADSFEGELILFGSSEFPDWSKVVDLLVSRNAESEYRKLARLALNAFTNREHKGSFHLKCRCSHECNRFENRWNLFIDNVIINAKGSKASEVERDSRTAKCFLRKLGEIQVQKKRDPLNAFLEAPEIVHKWFEDFNAHQLLSGNTTEISEKTCLDIAEIVCRDTFEEAETNL
jgi:5'(3')-deoxyribonucleotidase